MVLEMLTSLSCISVLSSLTRDMEWLLLESSTIVADNTLLLMEQSSATSKFVSSLETFSYALFWMWIWSVLQASEASSVRVLLLSLLSLCTSSLSVRDQISDLLLLLSVVLLLVVLLQSLLLSSLVLLLLPKLLSLTGLTTSFETAVPFCVNGLLFEESNCLHCMVLQVETCPTAALIRTAGSKS